MSICHFSSWRLLDQKSVKVPLLYTIAKVRCGLKINFIKVSKQMLNFNSVTSPTNLHSVLTVKQLLKRLTNFNELMNQACKIYEGLMVLPK